MHQYLTKEPLVYVLHNIEDARRNDENIMAFIPFQEKTRKIGVHKPIFIKYFHYTKKNKVKTSKNT